MIYPMKYYSFDDYQPNAHLSKVINYKPYLYMKSINNGLMVYSVITLVVQTLAAIILNTTRSEAGFDSTFKDTMLTNVCFGIPFQCFNLVYETGVSFAMIGQSKGTSIFFEKEFEKAFSTTCKNPPPLFYTFPYHKGEIKGLELTETISLNNSDSIINSMSFILAFNASIKYEAEGVLGLAPYHPNSIAGNSLFNSRYSFVESAYQGKLINRRAFSHKYINQNNGLLYIGEIPYDTSMYSKCKGDSNNFLFTKWYCEMTSMTFSDNEALKIGGKGEKKLYAVFTTGHLNIRLPSIEGEYLLAYLLALNQRNCWMTEDGPQKVYQRLICGLSIRSEELPDVYFNFEGFRLVLPHSELFVLNTDLYYECAIIIEKNLKYIALGARILKNYDMVFDYTDNSVGFSSWRGGDTYNAPETSSVTNSNNFRKMTMGIILLLCVLGILFELALRLCMVKRIQQER